MHTSESQWSRLLLVEGVPGVGKSTLLDALLRAYVQQRPAKHLRTLLQAEMLQQLAATRMPTLVLDAEDPRDRSIDAAFRFWFERR